MGEGMLPIHLVFGYMYQFTGRRKSSQKLAKRRAFVWGEGVSTVFAKQASKKKKKN